VVFLSAWEKRTELIPLCVIILNVKCTRQEVKYDGCYEQYILSAAWDREGNV